MEGYEIASGVLGAIVGIVKMNVTWCILAMVAEALTAFIAGSV
jgi:hypothetical protein